MDSSPVYPGSPIKSTFLQSKPTVFLHQYMFDFSPLCVTCSVSPSSQQLSPELKRSQKRPFHRLELVKKCFSTSPHSHAHYHLQKGPRAKAPKKVPKKGPDNLVARVSRHSPLSPARRHWPNWAKLTAAATILRPKLGPQPPQAPAPPTTRRFPHKIFRYFSQIFAFCGNVFFVKCISEYFGKISDISFNILKERHWCGNQD